MGLHEIKKLLYNKSSPDWRSSPKKGENLCQLYIISRPARAPTRNLTGSIGRLRKDKRQTCKKLGSGGLGNLVEIHNSLEPSSEFFICSGKPGSGIAKSAEQQFLGWRDLVVIGNSGNLWSLLSAHSVPVWRSWCKHPCSYTKQLCCILLLLPFAAGGCAHPSLQIIWHSCAHIKFSQASHTLLSTTSDKGLITRVYKELKNKKSPTQWKKWANKPSSFFKGRSSNGQKTHEEMLNIPGHEGNTNQKHI
jgi:hypothetical protein